MGHFQEHKSSYLIFLEILSFVCVCFLFSLDCFLFLNYCLQDIETLLTYFIFQQLQILKSLFIQVHLITVGPLLTGLLATELWPDKPTCCGNSNFNHLLPCYWAQLLITCTQHIRAPAIRVHVDLSTAIRENKLFDFRETAE